MVTILSMVTCLQHSGDDLVDGDDLVNGDVSSALEQW